MRGSHHSSPASALLPAETQEERTPDGAASASAEQDPHRFPATGPWPGRHTGETRPHGTRPWRAVWHENGERQQCEAASEEKLAAKLEKVTERLEADAPNMTLRGADLIAYYLSPDRLPVRGQ